MEPLYEIAILTLLFLLLIVHGDIHGPKIQSFLVNHIIALLLAFALSYLVYQYKN